MTTYQVVWFLLIGVLLTGYAILDGFDLGVGFWHLFARQDRERRQLLASIGPVWDGNEVWLLTGAGAIFAAFPPVYATVFSGFYVAMMLLLAALIFRAVSIELRSKVESKRWRLAWDLAFSLGSTLAAVLFGLALGNVLRGVPIDDRGEFAGTFVGLLNPFALVVGLLALAMVATHGALWIAVKTEGDLAERARRWALSASLVYLGLFLLAAALTLTGQGHLLEGYAARPALWAAPAVALVAMALVPVLARARRAGRAFLASALSIAGLLGTAGAGLFPRLLPASGDLGRSLTVWNSSSSELTLKTMLVLAAVGMPLVVGYTVYVYWAFRGKVQLDEHGY